MEKNKDGLKTTRQHDEKVFRDSGAIFTENDLRELINNIYSGYQYKGAQFDKLARLIDFLASESNKFSKPELAGESQKLSTYLGNFWDFLKNNFYQGGKAEDGDTIYLFQTQETSSETEAFLIEFQMVSMDVENAYRNYRAAVIGILKI